MSHFAKVENNIVTNVIVAEQDFIDTLDGTWVQTSYNTHGGKHYDQDGNVDGEGLRKNYAGIGYTYDSSRDAFIPSQPFNSWVLNENTCLWEAPIERPTETEEQVASGQHYMWVEESYQADNTQGWVLVGGGA